MTALLSSHATHWRFVRFLVTGVVNTAVGYGLYAFFVFVGLPPQVALTAAFVLGVLWNYFGHARFVFGVAGYSRLPAYAAAYVVIYVINALALHAALRAGFSPYVAQAVLSLVMAVLSFILISAVLKGAPARASRTASADRKAR